MRSYLSYFVSQNPKTIKSLSVFKDDTTSSYRAFDEEGNVEDITSTPSLSITDIQAPSIGDIGGLSVIIDDTINGVVTLNRVGVNAKIGYVTINLEDNEITSGSTLQIPIDNSFVTANSVIFLTLEGLNTSGSTNNNKGIILNVINKAPGEFTITLCSIWGINLNGATNYYEDSFRVNFIIF